MNIDYFASPADEKRAIAASWQRWAETTLAEQICDQSSNDGAYEEHHTGFYDGRQTGFILPRIFAVREWSDLITIPREKLEASFRRGLAFLLRRQAPDGRLDLGGSYSPNEVGFTLPAMVEVYRRLSARKNDALHDCLPQIEQFIRRGAQAVLDGEPHTANHRWAACTGPLAAVQTLWPDRQFMAKIDEYLADGFDCDDDGCWYEERSANYNMVANHGLIVLADALKRPEYLKPVIRNLEFVLKFMQPNGEMDTSFSHRQDRAVPNCTPCWYDIARRVALETGDGRFTALAMHAWKLSAGAPQDLFPLLFDVDRNPGPLPAPKPIFTDVHTFAKSVAAVRVRRNQTALTLSADRGHHFFDTVRDQWGGPKRSDDWFHLHHGDIVLQSIHLAVANMHNIQPTSISEEPADHVRLAGYVDSWIHTEHFRPGSPKVKMPWDLSYQIDAALKLPTIGLDLDVASPHALIASLRLHLRPGVTIREGDGDPITLSATQQIQLRGGAPLIISSATHTLTITGLPAAAHHATIAPASPIPSAIGRVCATLSLGLTMPVKLHLDLTLGQK